jgi:iron complex outermembrane receptor protein
LPVFSPAAVAQVAGGATITGSVMDSKGGLLVKASIAVRSEATGKTMNVVTDATGHFTLTGLAAGTYNLQATAPGFGTTLKGVRVTDGGTMDVALTLTIGDLTQQVTVEANAQGSVAAALAPMDALLEATSARTEITSQFIQNFTAPTADYGETVQMAPGTFTTNGNGVGLGQSKTYFRGFSDGSYDIDFDGIPFYDTNSPTHHSWAFFPSQWLGGVDFDRSPGTASTIGPTPFGGSIHLLSKEVSPVQNLRGGVSYGSFNTMLIDGQYDSGMMLNRKFAFEADVHHMSSDGYQTFNFQNRSAGSIKAQYKISDKTMLTGFAGVVFLDANTPGFNATRCQIYGVQTGYTCTGTLAPFAGSGLNFYLTDNSDPNNYLNYGYNKYHVPTDFEYVGLRKEMGHGFRLDFKGYTYNYDNSEVFTNATPITEATTINGSKTYNGLTIQPCNVPVTTSSKKTGISVTALPCGVDKYNSYRKYGETATVSQVSKFGVARFGMWYEWAKTNRHQIPSDPLTNYTDQAVPSFSEFFWTNSFQPFGEYEFHVTPKLSVTAGTKFAYYTIDLKQLADTGKTIGNLCSLTTPVVCAPFKRNNGSYSAWLPSLDGNYRLRSNWSAYGQVATGSVVPPSNVYDYYQTPTKAVPNPGLLTPPKQQRSTTYQVGTVLKLKRVTFDADFYHIRFQNSYSSTTDLTTSEQVFFLQPASITKGFEAESNIYIAKGLSAYLNASVGRATYTGNIYQSCVSGAPGCTSTTPVLTQSAPSGLWVAQAPSDVETEGVTYQRKAWDLGVFNKRVGRQYVDNGSYHNQSQIDPFSLTNLFFNYTIRSGSRFDQTKIRVSFNNVFDNHNLTGNTLAGSTVAAPVIAANGTTYADAFNTAGPTAPNGGDNVSLLAGRSVMLSVTFGLSPKR